MLNAYCKRCITECYVKHISYAPLRIWHRKYCIYHFFPPILYFALNAEHGNNNNNAYNMLFVYLVMGNIKLSLLLSKIGETKDEEYKILNKF